MIDKKNVKRSFSRAAATYEESSVVQKEVARELAGLISSLNGAGRPAPGAPSKRILDIGCGTGTLSRLLRGLYPGSTVLGLDISRQMALKALTLSGADGIRLVAADCEVLPLADGSFDMAASSLAYQWAPDTEGAFREAARALRPGGLLCLSTLGPDTLFELKASYEEVLAAKGSFIPYKNLNALASELSAAGFEVLRAERRTVVKRYKDLFELLRTLKRIGAFKRAESEKNGALCGGLKEVLRVYGERFPAPGPEGGVKATYEVIYICAKKA